MADPAAYWAIPALINSWANTSANPLINEFYETLPGTIDGLLLTPSASSIEAHWESHAAVAGFMDSSLQQMDATVGVLRGIRNTGAVVVGAGLVLATGGAALAPLFGASAYTGPPRR